MRTFDNPGREAGISRFRTLQGRIKLLNDGWHRRARAERIGTCAACEQAIKAGERAVHLHGELYHSDCAF